MAGPDEGKSGWQRHAHWEDLASPDRSTCNEQWAPMSLPREFVSDSYRARPSPLAARGPRRRQLGPKPRLPRGHLDRRAVEWFRQQFGPETEVFPVWNGTGANNDCVSLRALTRPW